MTNNEWNVVVIGTGGHIGLHVRLYKICKQNNIVQLVGGGGRIYQRNMESVWNLNELDLSLSYYDLLWASGPHLSPMLISPREMGCR